MSESERDDLARGFYSILVSSAGPSRARFDDDGRTTRSVVMSARARERDRRGDGGDATVG